MQPVGISTEHLDFPGTLTLPTEVALQTLARDRRQHRPRGHPQTGDGDEPRRQQRRHEPRRAGSARAPRHAGRHHQLVALRRAGRVVHGRGNPPRRAWRRDRDLDHARGLARSGAHRQDRQLHAVERRDGARFQMAQRASAGAVSHGPRRICIRAAPSATRRRPPQRRDARCSITARARSANC